MAADTIHGTHPLPTWQTVPLLRTRHSSAHAEEVGEGVNHLTMAMTSAASMQTSPREISLATVLAMVILRWSSWDAAMSSIRS